MKADRYWTEKEISFLKDWYANTSLSAMATVLGRSTASVKHKTYELGLPKLHPKPAQQYQPCWDCKWATNPIGNPCPWSKRLRPVPGWDATFILMRAQGERQQPMKSYKIHSCPLFKEG